MRGVILAGGTGSRLAPLTEAVNKHMLPVGDRPMIQHSIEKLVEAGITDIIVVTGGEHLGGIAEFLGGGARFRCDITYRVQESAGGIAEALLLCETFMCGTEDFVVILGDNVFEESIAKWSARFATHRAVSRKMSAKVMLKGVCDPERFGVPTFDSRGDISCITEKPSDPHSNYAITGIYFYGPEVFDIIRGLTRSDRGELEITDVNNAYIHNPDAVLVHEEMKGWWTDAGTHDSYQHANELVRRTNATKNS